MIKTINKIINWGIIVLVGLLPIFFLPFTSEFYEFNKNILLLTVSGLLLLVWGLRMVLEKKVSFRRTPFDLPVLAIAGAFILSTIFASSNKWAPFWIPGGTGTILGLTVLYFIITNNLHLGGVMASQARPATIRGDLARPIFNSLIISGVILSLIAIYQFIGLGESLIAEGSSWAFLRLKSWTPAGGLLPLATFLAVSLTLAVTRIYTNWKQEKLSISLYLYIFISLLILAGLGISIYQFFTTAKPLLLLPYSVSWAIAVEGFKNWRMFFFGVGPVSFLDAFSQFRPLSYNLGPLWSIRFGVSGNYYLHLLTTTGILGLGAFAWLILKVAKTRFTIYDLRFTIFLILVILLFLPSNFLLLFALYVLVGLFTLRPERETSEIDKETSEVKYHSWEYSEEGRILPWTIFVPILLVVIGGFWLIGRAYAAEVSFKHSLDALAENDGTSAYNHQIKAITLNPYNDNYRIVYSQTNLALANSLAAKSDLSDQDRQNITTLVQQAIREAKAATSLNKNKVINWENLANIYRQLINFAQGSDQWAIATMRQAIKLDSVNPNLKLNLGGIYYALGEYDEAIVWFQKAIDDKPNFANGYYNLAAAYREKGDYQKAHEAMQMTVNLVPSTSEDYQKARNELEELAKRLPHPETTLAAQATPSAAQPEESPVEAPLSEPQPLPSPVIKPPIELPEEQAAPEISPAPEATP